MDSSSTRHTLSVGNLCDCIARSVEAFHGREQGRVLFGRGDEFHEKGLLRSSMVSRCSFAPDLRYLVLLTLDQAGDSLDRPEQPISEHDLIPPLAAIAAPPTGDPTGERLPQRGVGCGG